MLPDFRIRQRDYLLETTRALSEELDLQEVLARIVRISAELLAGRASLIALREDSQWRIAAAFGIRSIPSLLFCPMEGQPQMAMGALPKNTLKKAIDEVLLEQKVDVK